MKLTVTDTKERSESRAHYKRLRKLSLYVRNFFKSFNLWIIAEIWNLIF